MKIHLKFFLPGIKEALGSNELEVALTGDTVRDLIDHLIVQYGHEVSAALYDEEGKPDPLVQILHNGEEWISTDELDTVLRDGDNLVFMLLMAGG